MSLLRSPHPRLAVALAAAIVGVVALAPGAQAVDPAATVRGTPGVLAYFPLDETTGTGVQDVVGGLTGALSGIPTLGATTARSDDSGAAVRLPGSSAIWLGTTLTLAGDVSLEAWINPQVGASGTRYIVSKGSSASGVHLSLDYANRVVFTVGTGSSATTTVGPVVPSGTWHQVVATLAGRATAVYVDGVQAATGSLSAAPATSTRTLYLGRYSGSTGGYWLGLLDEVSLYSTALSAGQVADHFAAVADVTPPVPLLTSTPAAVVSRGDATVQFTSSKRGGTFSCRLDSGPWTTCDGSVSYARLSEGTHSASVITTDRYGIAGRSAATAMWQVDLTPPDTLMLAARPASDGRSEASFASEDGASFDCQIAGAAWTPCASPLSVPAGATLAVRARDRSGNVDPSPATATLAPADDGSAQQYDGTRTSFVVAGARSATSLQCQVDNGDWQQCPAPLTFDRMTYGTHELAVRDQRQLAVSPSLEWHVELPAPRLIGARFPSLLTFASRRAQQRVKTAPRLLFQSNVDAAATATLLRAGRPVARWPVAVRRGTNIMTFPLARLRTLRASRYRLVVEPQNATGAGQGLALRFDVVQLRRR